MFTENRNPTSIEAEIAHFRDHVREQIHIMSEFGSINSDQEVYAELHIDDITKAYVVRANEWEEEYGMNLPLSVEMEILHSEIRKIIEHMRKTITPDPPLYETTLFHEAVTHFSHDIEHNIENDFVREHASELIFCYENRKTLIDFDFWTHYETLLEEKMTYDEYVALDGVYEDDPLDIDPADYETIAALKADLESYRCKPKPLAEQITEANNATNPQSSRRRKSRNPSFSSKGKSSNWRWLL